jgi:PAS domain S-box-containing protein
MKTGSSIVGTQTPNPVPEGLVRSLAEEAAEALFVTNAKGRAVFINRAARELLGVDDGWVHHHPEVQSWMEPSEKLKWNLLLKEPSASERVVICFFSEARAKACEVKGSDWTGSEKEKFRIFHLQPSTGAQALSTDRLFRVINENLLEALYSTDLDGQLVYTNGAFKKLFTFSDNDIISESQLFAHPQQLRLIRSKLRKSGVIRNERVLLKKAMGRKFWALINGSTDTNADGGLTFHYAINDINEEIAHKLKYNQVLEQANSAILVCDEEMRVTYFNHAAEKLFGIGRDKVVGRPLVALLPQRLIDRLMEMTRSRSFAEAEMYKGTFDEELTKVNGSRFWGSINMNSTSIGSERQYIVFITDSTERIHYSRLLQEKNEELQKTNHQLDSFLYSAYHDLRSPLTTLLGLTNLMSQPESSDDMKTFGEMIQKTVKKLDRVLMDMVSFSKNAKQYVKSNLIHFNELIDHTLADLSHDFELSDYTIHRQINETIPFYSDEERLGIILTALVKNALQFSRIEEPRKTLTLQCTTLPDGLTLVVEDNGMGIGKGQFDKVFNMFYRGTDRSMGSGLGLYLVQETALKLKGTIQLESEVGEFTRFTLFIPNSIKGRLVSRKLELKC